MAQEERDDKDPKDAGGAADDGDDQKPKTVEMSQEDLDSLINKAFAKGARNGADPKKLQSLEDEVKELRGIKTEYDKLKAGGPGTGGGKSGESDDKFEERLSQIQTEWEEKYNGLETQLTEERDAHAQDKQKGFREQLRSEVLRAAAQGGALDPEDVFILMDQRGVFQRDDDEGRWQVLNPETKKVRIDVEAKGEPLSVEKAVREFLNERANLKRGSGRAGSGAADDQRDDREVPLPKDFDPTRARPSDVYANRRELVRHVAAGGSFSGVGQHNQGNR